MKSYRISTEEALRAKKLLSLSLVKWIEINAHAVFRLFTLAYEYGGINTITPTPRSTEKVATHVKYNIVQVALEEEMDFEKKSDFTDKEHILLDLMPERGNLVFLIIDDKERADETMLLASEVELAEKLLKSLKKFKGGSWDELLKELIPDKERNGHKQGAYVSLNVLLFVKRVLGDFPVFQSTTSPGETIFSRVFGVAKEVFELLDRYDGAKEIDEDSLSELRKKVQEFVLSMAYDYAYPLKGDRVGIYAIRKKDQYLVNPVSEILREWNMNIEESSLEEEKSALWDQYHLVAEEGDEEKRKEFDAELRRVAGYSVHKKEGVSLSFPLWVVFFGLSRLLRLMVEYNDKSPHDVFTEAEARGESYLGVVKFDLKELVGLFAEWTRRGRACPTPLEEIKEPFLIERVEKFLDSVRQEYGPGVSLKDYGIITIPINFDIYDSDIVRGEVEVGGMKVSYSEVPMFGTKKKFSNRSIWSDETTRRLLILLLPITDKELPHGAMLSLRQDIFRWKMNTMLRYHFDEFFSGSRCDSEGDKDLVEMITRQMEESGIYGPVGKENDEKRSEPTFYIFGKNGGKILIGTSEDFQKKNNEEVPIPFLRNSPIGYLFNQKKEGDYSFLVDPELEILRHFSEISHLGGQISSSISRPLSFSPVSLEDEGLVKLRAIYEEVGKKDLKTGQRLDIEDEFSPVPLLKAQEYTAKYLHIWIKFWDEEGVPEKVREGVAKALKSLSEFLERASSLTIAREILPPDKFQVPYLYTQEYVQRSVCVPGKGGGEMVRFVDFGLLKRWTERFVREFSRVKDLSSELNGIGTRYLITEWNLSMSIPEIKLNHMEIAREKLDNYVGPIVHIGDYPRVLEEKFFKEIEPLLKDLVGEHDIGHKTREFDFRYKRIRMALSHYLKLAKEVIREYVKRGNEDSLKNLICLDLRLLDTETFDILYTRIPLIEV